MRMVKRGNDDERKGAGEGKAGTSAGITEANIDEVEKETIDKVNKALVLFKEKGFTQYL